MRNLSGSSNSSNESDISALPSVVASSRGRGKKEDKRGELEELASSKETSLTSMGLLK